MASDDYRMKLNIVGWVLAGISVVVVSARSYTRFWVNRKHGWDDWFMLLALLSGLVCAALVSIGTYYGFGMHLNDITDPYRRTNAVKYCTLAPALSIISSTAGKISMVLFLVRLLGHTASRSHQLFLFSAAAIMVILNIFAIIIIVGRCYPAEKGWRPEISGSCMPKTFLDIGGRIQSIFNAVMDLITASFPAYMVWTLQINNSTKWGLTFLMGGGVFAAGATVVKTVMLKNVSNIPDITYAWGAIAIWYMAEIFILIIAGSIPTLRPLWNFARNKYSSNSYAIHEDGDKGSGMPSSSQGIHYGSGRTLSKPRRPGEVTIALEEIDKIRQKDVPIDSSSMESILRNETEQGSQRTHSPNSEIHWPLRESDENRRSHQGQRSTTSQVRLCRYEDENWWKTTPGHTNPFR